LHHRLVDSGIILPFSIDLEGISSRFGEPSQDIVLLTIPLAECPALQLPRFRLQPGHHYHVIGSINRDIDLSTCGNAPILLYNPQAQIEEIRLHIDQILVLCLGKGPVKKLPAFFLRQVVEHKFVGRCHKIVIIKEAMVSSVSAQVSCPPCGVHEMPGAVYLDRIPGVVVRAGEFLSRSVAVAFSIASDLDCLKARLPGQGRE